MTVAWELTAGWRFAWLAPPKAMIARLPVHLHVPALLLVSGMMQCAHAVAPTAPSGCSAVTFNPTATTASVAINWNDNSTDETYWTIQVSINNGAFADLGIPVVPAVTVVRA